jgi:hypothetical protein
MLLSKLANMVMARPCRLVCGIQGGKPRNVINARAAWYLPVSASRPKPIKK